MKFIQNEISQIDSTSIKCVCAINPNCIRPAIIVSPGIYYKVFDNLTYNVPGWIRACQVIDSLLLSTLEWLYIDSVSFPFFMYALGVMNKQYVSVIKSPLDNKPIVYNSSMSRFPPNTSNSIIVKEIMVEQWNHSLSYQRFYETCAPMYCSYPKTIRKNSFIEVIITIMSMMGGIVASLRILTPPIVKLILRLVTRANQNPREIEQGNSIFAQIQYNCSLT
ncbi:unnamed protein product [Adineta ricciae]|nr:unnamed protein product [Adineta ricciae]